jgi:hypothetical protein
LLAAIRFVNRRIIFVPTVIIDLEYRYTYHTIFRSILQRQLVHSIQRAPPGNYVPAQ